MHVVVRIAAWTGIIALAGSLNGVAFAHPGHGPGGGDHSLLHYLSTVEHLAIPALVACGGLLAAWLWKQSARNPQRRR